MYKDDSESRQINCSACGYESCTEMMVAIHNWFNSRYNCVYFEKEESIRLSRMSFVDQLTGVMNRNAMNNRISAITSGRERLDEPYAVVFADINGLKLMNDTQGHSAGDLLLKKAAIALQEVFAGDEIYRAGGDEFLIIAAGCEQGEADRKAALLKERSKDADAVSFAVGYSFGGGGRDIRDAMRTADESMYRDKEEFYKMHPDRKLRQ
jgi:diguanylate cyclase (GGDEF)-like protein